MPELLDITPSPENHVSEQVTVGEDVRPAWTLPIDAPRSKVEFDLAGGATVTGSQLEKTALGGGEYEYRPRFGSAPTVQSRYQLVTLRYTGDPGTVDQAVIRAEPVPG
jgi:hypothetical protein